MSANAGSVVEKCETFTLELYCDGMQLLGSDVKTAGVPLLCADSVLYRLKFKSI